MRRTAAIGLALLAFGCDHGAGSADGGGAGGTDVTPVVAATYTRQRDFLDGIGAFQDRRTSGFDGVASGTALPSGVPIEGLTPTYAIAPFSMTATAALPTTSAPNSLGLDGPDGATFSGGDGFVLAFDRSVHAVGLFVIGEDLAPGDVTLAAGGSSITTGALEPDVSVTGAQVYYLGLVDPAGFTSATLSTRTEGYVFNLDDVTTAVAP